MRRRFANGSREALGHLHGVKYNEPRGRWNLVTTCDECRRFMHDEKGEQFHPRAKWPPLVGMPPRSIGRFDYGSDVCTECRNPPKTPVAPCDFCGVFGGRRKVTDLRVPETYEALFDRRIPISVRRTLREWLNHPTRESWPADPGERWGRGAPRTCIACHKAQRKLVNGLLRLAMANEERLNLRRLQMQLKQEATERKEESAS